VKIIGACILRNAERYLPGLLRSLAWLDAVIICDDHSDDGTSESLLGYSTNKILRISILKPWFTEPMMAVGSRKRDTTRELAIRNDFVSRVFETEHPDAVILIDSDELVTCALRPHVERVVNTLELDSIALTCNHVFDESRYLHVYEQTWNGVRMVDPHVRVITRPQMYVIGDWPTSPDCFLRPSRKTLCLDGPFHYHLKYAKGSGPSNYSLSFLPNEINEFTAAEYLRYHRYPFPVDIASLITGVFNRNAVL
jgi:glycosyltransferase involved in cell wall biosynthesis